MSCREGASSHRVSQRPRLFPDSCPFLCGPVLPRLGLLPGDKDPFKIFFNHLHQYNSFIPGQLCSISIGYLSICRGIRVLNFTSNHSCLGYSSWHVNPEYRLKSTSAAMQGLALFSRQHADSSLWKACPCAKCKQMSPVPDCGANHPLCTNMHHQATIWRCNEVILLPIKAWVNQGLWV